ncbi:hypothetical protein SOASR014_33240 [Pectobacterium carotovorum subsp. carotovorum]|nr:hypothetical protein SOASR014_33240 [Pectobacterium carotovorum subsp. carotovorum]GLX45685.1 hypothetical protein Pcaca01_33530 [Pectobacterium carotovorum subsp. carotovorum]
MSDQVEIPSIDDLPDMQEAAEFTPPVKLLTTETPVLGYDGANINPANWQAKALADRTQWLRDRLLNLSTRLVLSVNGKTGNVVVTYSDVGADAAGTADGLMTAHLTALDPHAQYFDETRGDVRYVQRTLANQSNGWLQLDAAGKIPAVMLQTLASRYVVVANQAARLALTSSANLTICAQADIDQLFYLNGGDNPALAANWVAGQSATVSGVSSVFGRTGAVVAQNGDYDADKITETATRKFATPAEKTAWNAKQAALVSGTNIRSLFGNSLLGSGNLAPTPAQMGAAAAVHMHTTADVTDFTQKAQALIVNSLEAGPGVTLGQNPVSGKTIISATGGSGGGGGGGYIVVDRPSATAGQNHSFSFSSQSAFNLMAYALKEVAGATNQTYVVDDFNLSSESNYNATNAVVFDGQLKSYTGGIYATAPRGDFHYFLVPNGARSLSISGVDESIVPAMTSNTSPIGYVASASSIYDSRYNAYLAFDRKTTSGTGSDAWVGGTGAIPTADNPQWLRIDIPSALALSGYALTNRASGAINSPKSWKLQGSNNDGNTWETVHSVSNDTNNSAGAVRNFAIDGIVSAYSSYRLLIEEVFSNSSSSYVTLRELSLFPLNKFMINSGSDWYTAIDGVLSPMPVPVDPDDFNSNGFSQSGEIPDSQLSLLSEINIVSPATTNAKVLFTPQKQIAILRSLFSLASYGQINSATLTAVQTNDGFVRVAVTRDLVNWHVWRGGAWVDIGSMSADTASATKLITDGMTPSDLNGINAAGWTQLFASNNGVPDYLAFAFALNISDPATDVATIDRLTLNVNESSRWMLQTAAQVEISWRTDSVTFRTVTAGNYKLAYQIP